MCVAGRRPLFAVFDETILIVDVNVCDAYKQALPELGVPGYYWGTNCVQSVENGAHGETEERCVQGKCTIRIAPLFTDWCQTSWFEMWFAPQHLRVLDAKPRLESRIKRFNRCSFACTRFHRQVHDQVSEPA